MAEHAPWRELAVTPLAPREARRMLDEAMAEAGVTDRRDDALVVVSELVTNALLHAEPPIRVAFSCDDFRIRIEVGDGSTDATPLPRDPSHDDPRGRGMLLVSSLVDRWGTAERDGLKVVWAELDRG